MHKSVGARVAIGPVTFSPLGARGGRVRCGPVAAPVASLDLLLVLVLLVFLLVYASRTRSPHASATPQPCHPSVHLAARVTVIAAFERGTRFDPSHPTQRRATAALAFIRPLLRLDSES